ncbi:phosphoglucomutase, alpha-D-glucose phosphate-specific [Marinobacterium nitratireducens]|uniref:Phosphoglucomutase n=1 Tax=Marinobacterium nitratireducens TaxID=518897 RepID=A0A917ZCU6_9GAMM|nr:phosphoglucomutase (alpha-D-glucose-1,6-bisphosphate-dependent) [Marinobacterium nitratireducens]GGO79531.1 phosphoglucomutase, alpha-D-glucose phosphate-specific [Marinobacterium nitratireducens]
MDTIDSLISAYYQTVPDAGIASQRVSFGTSGHRGSSLSASFNEAHILAITQAVVDYRREQGIAGPLFIGLDTHALSGPAFETALSVLVANGVRVMLDAAGGFTPTPLVSRAILTSNAKGGPDQADGLIITPSHNPPEDGGIKYNTPDGGPADANVTGWIETQANELLKTGLVNVQRMPVDQARQQAEPYDFVGEYVAALSSVIDMDAIRAANIHIGVDPMGGTSLASWDAISDKFGLNIEVVNRAQSPDFAFMPPDHDGKIRMDCSSTAAMANLLEIRERFDLAFGNDPDADRHGIVDASGLMNPNHYLAVCIDYLVSHRPQWLSGLSIGKTLVSSSMIDRVVEGRGHQLFEVPVGFKWFVPGLHKGELAFGGEESAGASFLTRDGNPWSTDKDGIILCLLAAEILAVTGKTPSEYYAELTKRYGAPLYKRIDSPATVEQKARLKSLTAADIKTSTLAGDPIAGCFTEAPGNGAAIGGLKVVTENGWFAARPSGTEALCKVYAESFKDEAHLQAILDEAQRLVDLV